MVAAAEYSRIVCRVNNPTLNTNALVKAWLAQNPVTVCYPLITPITYHFSTASELRTLLGQNNVWCDTGKIVKLDYPEDTKLYIDNKITQAIANALNA